MMCKPKPAEVEYGEGYTRCDGCGQWIRKSQGFRVIDGQVFHNVPGRNTCISKFHITPSQLELELARDEQ